MSPGESGRRWTATGHHAATTAGRSITSSYSARRRDPGANSRNFVLCPGKAYDRSPCGTGTSAKLACLFADGKLAEGRGLAAGEHHRQRLRGLACAVEGGEIMPRIRGTAYINAEVDLAHRPRDPFAMGIRP